jgi:hypothetical protein
MTGIGLLLTFVAILVGLSKLHAEGPTVVGIDGLINGLAGKFLTSIVGLICANLFVMIEHRVVARLTRLHHEFLDLIDELFPRKTLEQMVENLALPAEGDRTTLSRPRPELGDGWVSGAADQLSPAVAALTAAVRSLHALKSEDRQPLEVHFPDDLAKALREGLEPKIAKLGESIQTLIGSLEESRTHQKEQHARLETILTRLNRSLDLAANSPLPRSERPAAVTRLTSSEVAPRFSKSSAIASEAKVGSAATAKTLPARTTSVPVHPGRPSSQP